MIIQFLLTFEVSTWGVYNRRTMVTFYLYKLLVVKRDK